jgi:hypothetical protein
MILRVRIAVISVLALTAPSLARSQEAEAASQEAEAAPWALFSVRYDTRTSDFIYAAYGYGHAFAMVGALQNPRSGYTELLGAVGSTFAIGDGPTQSVALGAARASDSWYAQLYYLPSLHRGPLWIRATSELYLPLSRAGTLQFCVSPLSATVPILSVVEAGVAMDVSASRGARTSSAIGPELRVALPKAVLGTDVQKVLDERATRLRVFFTTTF